MQQINQSKPTRAVRKNTQLKVDDKILAALQRLVLLNEAETNRMIPSVPDIPRMPLRRNVPHTETFSYAGPSINSSSSVEGQGALAFALNNVPGYTSWTSSFDSYRILRVYVEFVPYGVSPNGSSQGNITTMIDYADASPATQSQLLQSDTAMTVDSNRYFERRLQPRSATLLSSGTVTSAYGQNINQWVDSTSPNAQHYGLKYAQSLGIAITVYNTIVTMVVQFRNND